MNAGKVELITQADWVLSHCGRKQPPTGSVVYWYKGFQLQAVLAAANDQSAPSSQYYVIITGDTNWCWRSISAALSASPPAIMAQVTDPDGKVLFNGLLDFTSIAAYGSNRFVLTNEIECEPGSKIQITLDDEFFNAQAAQPVAALLGGAYAYYLKDGIRGNDYQALAADLPRVLGTVNQNILAPCWMMGVGPETPDGFTDYPFTYGNGTSNSATVTLGKSLTTKCVIPIDATEDFIVWRFLFDVTQDATVTGGTFLVRIRAGSGYVFTDDYLDVAKYLGSSYVLKGWQVRRADSIIFEITLVDGTGSGNLSIQCFANGVKRRPKVA